MRIYERKKEKEKESERVKNVDEVERERKSWPVHSPGCDVGIIMVRVGVCGLLSL